jgi:hypothetical protein
MTQIDQSKNNEMCAKKIRIIYIEEMKEIYWDNARQAAESLLVQEQWSVELANLMYFPMHHRV